MISFDKLQLVKVMITPSDVYQIIPILENAIKLISVDIRKQQKLDADPKAIQQINFTGNLWKEEGSTMFFVIDEAKKTLLDFSKVAVKVL